jgi:hypothetical protein
MTSCDVDQVVSFRFNFRNREFELAQLCCSSAFSEENQAIKISPILAPAPIQIPIGIHKFSVVRNDEALLVYGLFDNSLIARTAQVKVIYRVDRNFLGECFSQIATEIFIQEDSQFWHRARFSDWKT